MSIVQAEVLIESKSLRTETLRKASPTDLESVLAAAKVHALFQALWKSEGWATTAQIAEYYEVTDDLVRLVVSRHRDEFENAGYATPKRSELSAEENSIISILSESRKLPALFNPRSAVLLGMLLRDSAIAAGVRTALLNIAESYATLVAKVEELQSELAIATDRIERLENSVLTLENLYTSVQQQIQPLLPISSTVAASGWKPETWDSLPSQDKRHYRFLYRRRRFIPSDQGLEPAQSSLPRSFCPADFAPKALPVVSVETMKQRQRDEVASIQGDISVEEMERLAEAKAKMLEEFWKE